MTKLKFGSVWSVFVGHFFLNWLKKHPTTEELGQLLHALLPHIRRSLQLIQHDRVPEILVCWKKWQATIDPMATEAVIENLIVP